MDIQLYTLRDVTALFGQIEKAIVANGKFEQKLTPEFRMNELGCRFVVRVKLKSSRKSPGEIHGSGDNPGDAAENLMSGLDVWAEAWG